MNMKKEYGIRVMLNPGYFVFTFLTICFQLNAFPTCPENCRCTEIEIDGPETLVVYVRCSGVIRDLGALQFPQKDVEFLDVSDTSLQTIPPYYFLDRGLVEIVELNLSGNNLSHIYHDVFVGLNNLKILDLSYNKIKYFDPHSLIYNDLLTHLLMKGTEIPVSEGSLVISRSLELLDISECGIRTLPDLALSEIPYLKILNVSLNPLLGIDPKALDNLKRLKQLDITRTYIKCDRNLAALSEWGKAASIAITGYPCLNSHSSQGYWYRSNQKLTASDYSSEWPRLSSVAEDLREHDSVETSESEEVENLEDFDFENNDSDDDASYSDDTPSEYSDIPESVDLPKANSTVWSEFLPEVHWTIWLACVGGFGLGVALSIGLGFAVYICCWQTEDPNEVVSAGEDFQLVPSMVEGPIIRDEPPSYSSLFSSRYHKVLPTPAVHLTHVLGR